MGANQMIILCRDFVFSEQKTPIKHNNAIARSTVCSAFLYFNTSAVGSPVYCGKPLGKGQSEKLTEKRRMICRRNSNSCLLQQGPFEISSRRGLRCPPSDPGSCTTLLSRTIWGYASAERHALSRNTCPPPWDTLKLIPILWQE